MIVVEYKCRGLLYDKKNILLHADGIFTLLYDEINDLFLYLYFITDCVFIFYINKRMD
jgi:hypothetical protein